MGNMDEPVDLASGGQWEAQAQQKTADARKYLLDTLDIAFRVLNARLLTLLALLGAGVLFGVAVAAPDQQRTIAAALYAVLVLCPVLWKGGKANV